MGATEQDAGFAPPRQHRRNVHTDVLVISGSSLALAATSCRFAFRFSRRVTKRIVDVFELRLDDFLALLQLLLEAALLLASQFLKPDVTYRP